MKILKETCYGIIPLSYESNAWEAFIVQHLEGKHFGFPKGHHEKGESPKQTAKRELEEETGMHIIRYLPHPYLVERYQYRGPKGELIDKTVRYYLAEVERHFSLQKGEIIQGKWVLLKDLLPYITFEEGKNLIHLLISTLEDVDPTHYQ